MTTQCTDRLSGESFEIDISHDAELQIEAYIRDGIDADTGAVDYDVVTDDGRTYSGTVQAAD